MRLQRRDIIMPVFVCEGVGVRREVGSMPGVYQMSVDVAADRFSKGEGWVCGVSGVWGDRQIKEKIAQGSNGGSTRRMWFAGCCGK